jgi:hypothetical protein
MDAICKSRMLIEQQIASVLCEWRALPQRRGLSELGLQRYRESCNIFTFRYPRQTGKTTALLNLVSDHDVVICRREEACRRNMKLMHRTKPNNRTLFARTDMRNFEGLSFETVWFEDTPVDSTILKSMLVCGAINIDTIIIGLS